jgi:hypothetical protein
MISGDDLLYFFDGFVVLKVLELEKGRDIKTGDLCS